MSEMIHPETGFCIGDPEKNPLPRKSFPSREERAKALESFILSASGFRKVFAASGEENSLEESVAPPDLYLAALAALAFADFLEVRYPDRKRPILLGMDTRPTGPAIADVMARIFLASGIAVRYLFIAAAPEIMALARKSSALPADSGDFAIGFCYVSASHNPPGYNGIKFGLGEGGVLSPEDAGILIRTIKSAAAEEKSAERIVSLLEEADSGDLASVYAGTGAWKRKALSAYGDFTREIVSGTEDPALGDRYFAVLSESMEKRPIGIVAEMNGSARSLSIDIDFLEKIGIRVHPVNAKPRAFAHRIVPEGSSLEPCRVELAMAHERNPAFLFGYVPDCDGDRGNIVYFDEKTGDARILEAQEVFALCCVAELGSLAVSGAGAHGDSGKRLAIAVNDPTSMRIDRIAEAFGAELHRAEVGEANVVRLARTLRERGYTVRILGEGSNGGNITHPSAVRDPMDSLFALVKIFSLRDEKGGIFGEWLRRSGRGNAFRADFSFSDIVSSLPAFTTTSVFEERALMKIRSADHAGLKKRYQKIFESEWKSRLPLLRERFGLSSWEAVGYRGIEETRSLASFADSGKGGLKILLKDDSGTARAFIWMRGSGTEPVFRIMADVEGQRPEAEAWLLSWQREILSKADEA